MSLAWQKHASRTAPTVLRPHEAVRPEPGRGGQDQVGGLHRQAPPPSVAILRRIGVQFRIIGRHLRSCYQQLDGSVELADICLCRTEWDPEFRIERRRDCPIDEHKIQALGNKDRRRR